MPRAARPASNFTSDRHVLYAGWVLGTALRSGLPIAPVVDAEGNYTNRVLFTPPLGGDNPPTFTLMIPPPPDDWDLFASPTTNGPVFRGEDV